MAIATLSMCFDNHDVFVKNVKIPREETEKVYTVKKSKNDDCHLVNRRNCFARNACSLYILWSILVDNEE
jgi:hypothetical protein